MRSRSDLERVSRDVVACRACPRLVAWRQESAAHPPRRFRGQTYWARPIPGFGEANGRLVVVGLAPAAHGGNRTGRVFTGDSSGAFLFRALHEAGFANQAESVSRDDGLAVTGAYVTAAVRCAPPHNRPTPEEFRRCQPFLERELAALRSARVVLALGALAWDATLRALAAHGAVVPRPRPKFAHGAEARAGGILLLGSYHVSQQNTNTGRLTHAMLGEVLARARRALGR